MSTAFSASALTMWQPVRSSWMCVYCCVYGCVWQRGITTTQLTRWWVVWQDTIVKYRLPMPARMLWRHGLNYCVVLTPSRTRATSCVLFTHKPLQRCGGCTASFLATSSRHVRVHRQCFQSATSTRHRFVKSRKPTDLPPRSVQIATAFASLASESSIRSCPATSESRRGRLLTTTLEKCWVRACRVKWAMVSRRNCVCATGSTGHHQGAELYTIGQKARIAGLDRKYVQGRVCGARGRTDGGCLQVVCGRPECDRWGRSSCR